MHISHNHIYKIIKCWRRFFRETHFFIVVVVYSLRNTIDQTKAITYRKLITFFNFLCFQ